MMTLSLSPLIQAERVGLGVLIFYLSSQRAYRLDPFFGLIVKLIGLPLPCRASLRDRAT